MATKRTAADRERDLNAEEIREHDANPDPITGEPGAHPVGAGLGAAMGGAATGAAAGAVAGPVAAGVGAVVGGIAGGLAGKEIAERIDPTVEEEYWRGEYATREYYDPTVGYPEIGPAYRYGWESRARHHDKTWEEVEAELERDWHVRRGTSTLEWQQAQPATRDAWERIDRTMVREVDEDTGQGLGPEPSEGPPRVPR